MPIENAERALAEFLTTVKIGELAVGMKLDAILAYLGPPDGYSTIQKYRSRLPKQKERHEFIGLNYGSLQLIVESTSDDLDCLSITLGDYQPRGLPQILDGGMFALMDGMNRQKFKAFADKYQIQCRKEIFDSPGVNAEALFLRIPVSEIGVSFDLTDGADKLYKITKCRWSRVYDSTEPWHFSEGN